MEVNHVRFEAFKLRKCLFAFQTFVTKNISIPSMELQPSRAMAITLFSNSIHSLSHNPFLSHHTSSLSQPLNSYTSITCPINLTLQLCSARHRMSTKEYTYNHEFCRRCIKCFTYSTLSFRGHLSVRCTT